MTRAAMLISRQSRAVAPSNWWLRAAASAAEWGVGRSLTLRTGAGLLPMDFITWCYEKRGGAVELVSAADPLNRSTWPERDLQVAKEADELVAVAVKPGGNMERLALEALAAGKTLWVIPAPEKESHGASEYAAAHRKLLEAGGRQLGLKISIPEPHSVPTVETRIPRWKRFLWHFTRSNAGAPWPGESAAEYFEALLSNAPNAAHTGLDALRRILSEKRLRASGKLIKGKFPVVCLTTCPPKEILEKSRFRPALLRWEFEPYAVGIPLERAKKLGVREVKYLSLHEFDSLGPSERHLFQKHQPPETDFRHEKEWRFLGDLDLSGIPEKDLALFAEK